MNMIADMEHKLADIRKRLVIESWKYERKQNESHDCKPHKWKLVTEDRNR